VPNINVRKEEKTDFMTGSNFDKLLESFFEEK
jgi:hypothetical protein